MSWSSPDKKIWKSLAILKDHTVILLSLTGALTGECHRDANVKYFMNVTFYGLNFLTAIS